MFFISVKKVIKYIEWIRVFPCSCWLLIELKKLLSMCNVLIQFKLMWLKLQWFLSYAFSKKYRTISFCLFNAKYNLWYKAHNVHCQLSNKQKHLTLDLEAEYIAMYIHEHSVRYQLIDYIPTDTSVVWFCSLELVTPIDLFLYTMSIRM